MKEDVNYPTTEQAPNLLLQLYDRLPLLKIY